MATDYQILKAIFKAYERNLVDSELVNWVIECTGCTAEQVESVLEEVREAWYK